MGDIADMILNGDLDEVTGEYIGEGYGYPRTLTNRNKSHNKIYRQSEVIITHFPDLKTKVLEQSGLNIYLPNKVVITVWWRLNKYCINNNWKYFADPSHADKQLIAIIEGFLPQIENPKNSNELNDKGTQACIDHIQRKIKTFDKVHPNKEESLARGILLSLTHELTQYL